MSRLLVSQLEKIFGPHGQTAAVHAAREEVVAGLERVGDIPGSR